jgi:hypothetical protein
MYFGHEINYQQMRKILLFPAALLLFSTISVWTLAGCGGAKEQKKDPATSEQYQCPMKCTEEIFTEPGTCPVCKMDLEKVANS